MTLYGDIDFYLRREREERLIAARCRDRAIAAIHLDMAERYAERAQAPPMHRAPLR